MINRICILFALGFQFIFIINNAFSKNNIQYFYQLNFFEDYPSDTTSIIDSVSESNEINQKNMLISQKDFFYADTKRFTLNGRLPNQITKIDPLSSCIVGASYILLFYVQHELQLRSIWKERGSFKIIEDGQYAFYADKAGHFFGTYFTSYLARESLLLTGLSWNDSYIIGMALGLAYTTYIEILDGFGVNWGFSPSDIYADIAGAALFIGQHYIPYLQNFTPKFMYFPANWHGEKKRQPHDGFIDDYSSHTLWLSLNIYNMLPDNWKNFIPSWLEITIGYAARNLFLDSNGYHGDPKFVIALDYNLIKLLPENGSVWNWLRQSINFIKFPSPAIEFGSKTRFYLLYPFTIKF